jgi:hypothetical protein
VLGLEFDLLHFEAAMIDPCVDIEFSQAPIDALAPGPTLMFKQRGCVPVADLWTKAPDFAHGQHHMCMRRGLPVRAEVPMHIQVGDHAARDELVSHELACEPDPFFRVELAWNRAFDFARQLRIFANFNGFGFIPQR